ncbi:MAG TPA: hypothetical protein VK928_00420, partial [Longimicrobiales bacterium]|nr:hypothetical protein [Longimicrobiales bacterium]
QGAPGGQNPGMTQGAPGGGRPGQAGGRANRGIGGGDTRMGVVFVMTAEGVKPRPVVLGLNDWDHTEVIRGVEPGEELVLISVARLQQQQQDMMNRMRSNSSGPIPGMGGPGGPPRR